MDRLGIFVITASFFLPAIQSEKCINIIQKKEIGIVCDGITKREYNDWILKVGPKLKRFIDPMESDIYSDFKISLTIKNSNFPNIDYWITKPLDLTNLAPYVHKFSIINSSVETIKMWSLNGISLTETLDLSDNKISNYYFLRGMSNINNLILSRNNLNNVDLVDSLYLEYNEKRNLIDLSSSNLTNFNWNSKIKAKDLTINLSNIITLKFINLKRAPNLSLNVSGDINLKNITIVDAFKDLHMNDLGDNFDISIIKKLNLNRLFLRNNTIKILKKSKIDFRDMLDAKYYNNENKYLDLTNCKIVVIEAKYFFHYRIKSILLSDNYIKNLSELTFGDSVIENLDLSNNKIIIIDNTAFQNLETNLLNLSNNELSSLEGVFLNIDSIKELDLSFNPLKIVNENTFNNCTSLKKLYLTNCHFYNNFNRPLLNNLINLENLEVSYLYNIQNSYVTNLVIRDSNITEITTDALKNFINLQEIKFLNTTLVNKNNYAFLKSIPKLSKIDSSIPMYINNQPIFKHLKSLKFLDISQYSIAKLTKEEFENLNNLIYLNASNNLIASIEINAFGGQKNLKILSLAFNNISNLPEGIFGSLNKLRNLHLDHNQLEVLTDALLIPLTNLEYLDISFNHLKSFTANLPKLKYLYLQLNKLDYGNMGNLSLNSLNTIDISFNKGSCANLEELIRKFKKNFVQYLPVVYDFDEPNISGIGCLD